ncbi:hypothetical protein ACWGMA_00935 [Streptomyces asiaticus]
MAEFLRGAPGLPAALFGLALLVVAGYRLMVRVGGAGAGARGGDGVRAGTAGTPLTAVVVTGVALTWFAALAGDALSERHWLRVAVLPAVAGAGWAGVTLQRRLNHRFPPARHVRERVVGRLCVIRTPRVGLDSGRGDVALEDGSTVTIEVRTHDTGLVRGSRALVVGHDTEGAMFRVVAFEPPSRGAGLPPEQRRAGVDPVVYGRGGAGR